MINTGGMFSLLYGLWEYVFRKEELRVLILGLDKAGKTTLLEKLKVRDEHRIYFRMAHSLQVYVIEHADHDCSPSSRWSKPLCWTYDLMSFCQAAIC